MSIRTDKEWNTDAWPGSELMYPPPDWHGVSPAVIANQGRPWNQDQTDVPWIDRDDVQEQITARLERDEISELEAKLLRQYASEGYCITEHAWGGPDMELLDQYVADLDDLWTATEPLEGLQIMSLHIKDRKPGPVDHAELLSWPVEKRLELRDSQLWRIHYYHPHSAAGMGITKTKLILRMCELILGEPPALLNCLGFKRGSQVGLHVDLDAFHIHPANRLVGVWVACEDVHPGAGPLAVYPGTHGTPLWPGWNNYPQTCLRTCHLETRDGQERYLREVIEGMEPIPLVIKKGDVIFQHPLQIHEAARITDDTVTRRSMVLHYSIEGADKMHEVEGPFNW